jgi:hypothetical protein
VLLEREPGLQFDQALFQCGVGQWRAHASGLRTERPRPMP